jgi:hypothetical protein
MLETTDFVLCQLPHAGDIERDAAIVVGSHDTSVSTVRLIVLESALVMLMTVSGSIASNSKQQEDSKRNNA